METREKGEKEDAKFGGEGGSDGEELEKMEFWGKDRGKGEGDYADVRWALRGRDKASRGQGVRGGG